MEKKIIFLLLGLIAFSGMALGYTTQTTYETGTATTAALTIITPDKSIKGYLLLNDSSTTGENIYFNPEGDLTAVRMTSEAFPLKPGEWTSEDNFRTKRMFLLSANGTPIYRIWMFY